MMCWELQAMKTETGWRLCSQPFHFKGSRKYEKYTSHYETGWTCDVRNQGVTRRSHVERERDWCGVRSRMPSNLPMECPGSWCHITTLQAGKGPCWKDLQATKGTLGQRQKL